MTFQGWRVLPTGATVDVGLWSEAENFDEAGIQQDRHIAGWGRFVGLGVPGLWVGFAREGRFKPGTCPADTQP